MKNSDIGKRFLELLLWFCYTLLNGEQLCFEPTVTEPQVPDAELGRGRSYSSMHMAVTTVCEDAGAGYQSRLILRPSAATRSSFRGFNNDEKQSKYNFGRY